MNVELSEEAREYGRQATKALEAAGGDLLVQRAEADPDVRATVVAPVFEELGAFELDPLGSADEAEAAAALCRAAGWWAAPYPLAERLAGLLVVDPAAPSGAVAGLDLPWAAATLDGNRFTATPGPVADPRKTAFVTPLDLAPAGTAADRALALGLTLPCWTLLGMLDRAMVLTRTYVTEREQFGQPISQFQGVQFQLTDAEVERAGVEELAKYALWSIEAGLPEAVDDALALRLAAVEAAEVVFRICHQLHGAIGFCDETTISWLSRASQPLRRLPFGPGATRHALVTRLGRRGLTGLFS